jgi:hypothetical protein
MYILPYIGEESGIQAVPELSRLMGSARSTEDGIVIPDMLIPDMLIPGMCR